MPVMEYLERNAKLYTDEVALVELNPDQHDTRRTTWKEFELIESSRFEPYRREITWGIFNEKANRFANMLLGRGIKKGDKVAIIMYNCLEWLPIYFGILKTGAIAVPFNFRYDASEILYCVELAEVDVIVFGPEFIGRIEVNAEKLSKGRLLIYVGDNCPSFAESYRELVADCSSKNPDIEITDDDFGAIYYSSGTTGFPKAILHKHQSLTQAAIMEQVHHGTDRDDTFLCIPPLYHTGAKFHWMGSLVAGSKAVLLKGTKPEAILSAVSNEHCTIVWLLVPWVQDILDMLEYANAPAETSYYGALRAGNSMTEPFEIKYVQLIGQSNGLGDLKKAIEEKFNEVTVLAENDIAIIKNDERDMGATLDNAKQMIMADGFILSGDTFNDFIEYSANSISYSPTYYSQMLISNNNGSNQIIENVSAFEHEMITTTATLNREKNIISINFVNYNSSYKASIDLNGFSDVTTASIQYVYDGYTSAYNDIDKQYIAPKEEALEINGNHIEAEIPENSVCVIRITYNNAGEDMLYSLPEQLNLKAKNYVPPAIIVILIALGISFPIGLIAGNIIYKNKAKGRKKDE